LTTNNINQHETQTPQKETLEVVVEKLDGIPRWLALYGHIAVQKKRFDIFGEVFEEAATLALSEFSKLRSIQTSTHTFSEP